MRVRLLTVVIAFAAMILLVGMVTAQEAAKPAEAAPAAKHAFVGAEKCKMCHMKENLYASWAASKHATAFDKLTPEEQKKEENKKYYTTGTTAEGKLLTGVQCEGCHGAGADYKTMATMKDKAKAKEAGLVMPDAKTCEGCHNDKAPAALAAIGKDFDFAKAVAKGVHAMPAKKEAPAPEKK
jgi:cytochrome c5